MRRLLDLWNRVWFAPVDARALGVMRVTLGLLLLVFHISLWPELTRFFGDTGVLDPRALREGWTPWRWSHLDGLDPTGLHLAHGAGLLVILAFTLGIGGRFTAWLTFALLVATWHRDPFLQNGGDRLLRIWTLSLALSPLTRAVSVDAWWARRQGRPLPTTVPAVSTRLVQLQLMVMYGYTAIAKMSGSTWVNGNAIYYALSDLGYSRAPALADAALAIPAVRLAARVATWATLGWELAFVPLVLWRRTRWIALGIGLLVHGGIWLSMSVGIFSWAAMWGYLAWIDPDKLGKWVGSSAK